MVTSLTVRDLGGGAFLLEWASDQPSPTFSVYRDGALVTTTRQTSLVVSVPVGEAPVYEVLDDAGAGPAPGYPNYALLAWYASAGAASYRVEEWVSAAWAGRATLEDDGRGYFTWRSRALEDAATHQFRVTPVGANGNDGTPKSFVVLMVRIPTPPSVDYAYDAGTGAVTISAA